MSRSLRLCLLNRMDEIHLQLGNLTYREDSPIVWSDMFTIKAPSIIPSGFNSVEMSIGGLCQIHDSHSIARDMNKCILDSLNKKLK